VNPKGVYNPDPDPDPEEPMPSIYQLTLILPDGRHVMTIPSPANARFIHVNPSKGEAVLSDSEVPPVWPNCESFARVASAVHVRDEASALYVRVDQ
jgi:hypothetical protein